LGSLDLTIISQNGTLVGSSNYAELFKVLLETTWLKITANTDARWM